MKKRNIFAPLVGVKAKNTHVSAGGHSRNERWLYSILPSDEDAPTVEGEKNPKIFYYVYAIIFFLLVILFGRAFFLQVFEGKKSLVVALENRFRTSIIRAPRGLFYDRNSIPLVKNIPNYEVTVIPSDLPAKSKERTAIYENLSKVINLPVAEIKKVVESKEGGKKTASGRLLYTQPILVVKTVSRDTSILFESKQKELKGFYVETNPIREYLDGGALSHALGYVGRISEEEWKAHRDYGLTDYFGKSGLEKIYEKYLKGVDGKDRIEVDSKGKIIRTYGTQSPQAGDNLILSLDFELQKKLNEALVGQLNKAKVAKGTAIAVNPQNGEILAYVNQPTYDNNLFAKGISEKDYKNLLEDKNNPLLNRAISGEYPSGSIIKPYIAAAGLEEKIVNESTTVNSTGGITIGPYTFPDWKTGGHGVTNVVKAIAQSVNTYFYALGGGYNNIKGLGPTVMKRYLEKFGFGDYVGLDIDGEGKGHIPSAEWKEDVKGEQWYLGDSYNMAIGQGDVLVTPLQMANGLVALANGGTMYKLHFLKSVVQADGKPVLEKAPEKTKENFISAKTIDIVRRGMRETAVSGSARSLASLPVPAAGKTGTAQFGPNNSKKHSWFTAFAPYDNPQIAIVVLLEGAGEGSEFAVPVARETLQWYFTRK